MKLYFSMWAYQDHSRTGYDSFGANFYTEKPFGFSSRGDGQTAYYDADIPDTCTKEDAQRIGEKAVEFLKTGYYSAQRAVNMALSELGYTPA